MAGPAIVEAASIIRKYKEKLHPGKDYFLSGDVWELLQAYDRSPNVAKVYRALDYLEEIGEVIVDRLDKPYLYSWKEGEPKPKVSEEVKPLEEDYKKLIYDLLNSRKDWGNLDYRRLHAEILIDIGVVEKQKLGVPSRNR